MFFYGAENILVCDLRSFFKFRNRSTGLRKQVGVAQTHTITLLKSLVSQSLKVPTGKLSGNQHVKR